MADSVTSTSASIAATIERLRQLTQCNIQTQWRYHLGDLPEAIALQPETWQTWELAGVNDRHHIAWNRGRRVLWLGQMLVIPADLQGYALEGLSLRLALTWWAEVAQVYVNGKLVQEGDLFDCSARILLDPAVQPGTTIELAMRMVSPGHDPGALVRSHCLYERPNHSLKPCPEPGFVADELAVLQDYLQNFSPQHLGQVEAAIAQIDWSALIDRQQFDQALITLRQQLLPLGKWLQQRQVKLVGHAHLDLAWLWAIDETWDAAERTFKSVLQLQQDFPELTFCHSSPALYDWVEQNRPALFAQIQQQIATGRWEVVAGLWVEPELNTLSGESIVRQVLYGQRYVQQKFGQVSAIAWLPDSFGFCWQLPQILRQGEVEYFVTQKLRWNDSTEFPHEAFWWRSPDGTALFSLHSAPIGQEVDPVKISRYACAWEAKTGVPISLWLPGVGDHGGGPTRDMLEVARRWQRSPFFPQLKFSTVLDYLQTLSHLEAQTTQPGGQLQEIAPPELDPQTLANSAAPASTFNPQPSTLLPTPDFPTPDFPIWDDELYLEFHRGCYTSHADQKRSNRRCEVLLYQAEVLASLATLIAGADYPKSEIETAWKQVLFNQFHDILPGSAIPEVYVDANQAWQAAEHTAQRLVNTALAAIAPHIALPAIPQPHSQPIVVFNLLNWARSQVVAIDLPTAPTADQSWQILDLSGQALPVQFTPSQSGTPQLLFNATDVPGLGYRTFWLSPAQPPIASPPPGLEAGWILENEFLRVEVDAQTGNLTQVFDKVAQRDILSAPGNQLQAFQDSGQYWDAWNIDPNYAQHPLPAPQLHSIEWLEQGEVRSRLRIVRQLGQSEFCQDYVLNVGSAVLEIRTQVDWQEQHVLVKAAFPLTVEADYATYEIPFGAMARPTRPQTPQEQAKWEVPALHWADLGDATYGVSLLNDCKYGYDSQPNQLRLTLLRSPRWADPFSDLGWHEFTYALYPHQGSWQVAQTVRQGYELNQPLQVWLGEAIAQAASAALPPTGQFLNLSATNFVLSAFKQAEDNSAEWILRGYECHGESTPLTCQNSLGLAIAHPTNLLETPLPSDSPQQVAPWKIVTFKLEPLKRSRHAESRNAASS